MLIRIGDLRDGRDCLPASPRRWRSSAPLMRPQAPRSKTSRADRGIDYAPTSATRWRSPGSRSYQEPAIHETLVSGELAS